MSQKRMSRVQRAVLEHATQHPVTTYREVADETGKSLNGVYMAMAHLQAWGFVEASSCPTCARPYWVVTSAGQAALKEQEPRS